MCFSQAEFVLGLSLDLVDITWPVLQTWLGHKELFGLTLKVDYSVIIIQNNLVKCFGPRL